MIFENTDIPPYEEYSEKIKTAKTINELEVLEDEYIEKIYTIYCVNGSLHKFINPLWIGEELSSDSNVLSICIKSEGDRISNGDVNIKSRYIQIPIKNIDYILVEKNTIDCVGRIYDKKLELIEDESEDK